MSTPWTYILGSSEVMEGDESRLHDLDFAIRRECLWLEVNRRDAVEDGEEPAAEAADDGQRRWDEAVRVGGLALMAARDEARIELKKEAEVVAARPMRPARWVDSDDEEADKETSGNGGDSQDADSVGADSRPADGGTAKSQRRAKRLHEVRIPAGAVARFCQRLCGARSSGS